VELLQLKYFQLLAKELHVSKLAAELHISQPALTATIKKLERELGIDLFQKEGRRIQLTEYGVLYQAYIEDMFNALEGGKRALEQLKLENRQHLSLSLSSSNMWQSMLQCFSEHYPEITVDQLFSENAAKVISGQADFYIGAVSDWEEKRLDVRTLYQDDVVVLVNRNHRFAGRGHIDLSECKGEPCINLAHHTNMQEFIDELCHEAGFSPKIALECDYTLREEMVRRGYGISITTRRSVEDLDPDIFDYVYVASPQKKRVLSIATKKNRTYTQSMKIFFDYVLGYYGQPR